MNLRVNGSVSLNLICRVARDTILMESFPSICPLSQFGPIRHNKQHELGSNCSIGRLLANFYVHELSTLWRQYIMPGWMPLRWKKTLGFVDKVRSTVVYMLVSRPPPVDIKIRPFNWFQQITFVEKTNVEKTTNLLTKTFVLLANLTQKSYHIEGLFFILMLLSF